MARIRPETSFETTLSSGITSSQNTIALTTAPTETSGYMVIEPGLSNKEIIKYTGVTGTTLTGVSRGLALSGASDSAGTGKTDAAGSTVSMTNVHYYMEQLVNKTEANVWTADQTFETANILIGDGTTNEDEKVYANNGDANKPFLMYDASENAWVFSDDGTNTTKMVTGGGGLTAGTDITITSSAINLDPTISQAITFAEQVTIPATPVADTDAASKGYVDDNERWVFISTDTISASSSSITPSDTSTIPVGTRFIVCDLQSYTVEGSVYHAQVFGSVILINGILNTAYITGDGTGSTASILGGLYKITCSISGLTLTLTASTNGGGGATAWITGNVHYYT